MQLNATWDPRLGLIQKTFIHAKFMKRLKNKTRLQNCFAMQNFADCFASLAMLLLVAYSHFYQFLEASHILPCRYLFSVKPYPALKVGRCLNSSYQHCSRFIFPEYLAWPDVCYFYSSSLFIFFKFSSSASVEMQAGNIFPTGDD